MEAGRARPMRLIGFLRTLGFRRRRRKRRARAPRRGRRRRVLRAVMSTRVQNQRKESSTKLLKSIRRGFNNRLEYSTIV